MKILFGVAVFLAIIGGWIAFNAYSPRNVDLPDDQSRPANCMLWFIGSSSIHRWDSLSRDMAPWGAHNRGIEGATFDDIIPGFETIQPSEGRPTAIILYAGENDIARGIDVPTVVQQLKAFIAIRDRILKDVPIFILSAKPSPGRREYLAQQSRYNEEVKILAAKFPDIHYVDVTSPLLIDGKMGPNYQSDDIHMNDNGYHIWATVLRQRLDEVLPRSIVDNCGGRGKVIRPSAR